MEKKSQNSRLTRLGASRLPKPLRIGSVRQALARRASHSPSGQPLKKNFFIKSVWVLSKGYCGRLIEVPDFDYLIWLSIEQHFHQRGYCRHLREVSRPYKPPEFEIMFGERVSKLAETGTRESIAIF
ncbi:uncharacterized protein LOC114076894 [Solanum pennellii]|uniref:Uncharacterized protein LOC114076894 n=1 Tax=Solanum pennellii TaxID=28526 RepID=A0ABM1V9H5_SOLPN|nr:uncharacterized protein LOC114076894 [Solanum pennellii]